MRAVEKYYSVTETCLLLSVSSDTVIRRMRAGEFGPDCVNLGSAAGPDFRIPASGINAWLERCRVYTEPGIAARSVGELRRKVASKGQ